MKYEAKVDDKNGQPLVSRFLYEKFPNWWNFAVAKPTKTDNFSSKIPMAAFENGRFISTKLLDIFVNRFKKRQTSYSSSFSQKIRKL